MKRRITTALSALLASSLLLACDDGLFVDPAPAPTRADVALSILMAGGASSSPQAAFDRVDELRVRMVGNAGTVVDTTVAVNPDADDLAVVLDVPTTSTAETIEVTVDMRANNAVLFTGTSTVTVARGQTTEAEISPAPVPAGVRGPTLAAFTALGDSVTLAGAILFASGDTITDGPITWSSSNPGVVEVIGNRAFARSQGSAQIIATSGTFTAQSTANVAAAVGRLVLTPSSLELTPGATATINAVTQDRNGNTLTGRTVTWTSSHPTQATVVDGVVTAISEGDIIITATSEGVSAMASVVVAFEPVERVEFTPDTATIFIHGTVQLNALVYGASNTPMPKPVNWTSLDPLTATVSASGLVTGLSQGVAEIVATSENKSDTAFVTVLRNPVVDVRITPTNGTVAIGDSIPFTIELLDAQGRTTTGGYASQISNTNVIENAAIVPPVFWVRGRGNGSAYFIITSSDGPRDSVLVTVTGTEPGFVFTDSARVTTSSATIFGTAMLNGNPAQYFFEYATNPSYSGAIRESVRSVGPGVQTLTAIDTLTGLAPNTLYYFRLVVMVGGARYQTFDRVLLTGVPGLPGGLYTERSLNITAPYVGMEWDSPIAGTGQIQRSSDGVTWTNSPTPLGYGYTGSFSTVDPTGYWFRMRVCNTLGCSGYSPRMRAADPVVTNVTPTGPTSVDVVGHVTTYDDAVSIVAEVSPDSFFVSNVRTSTSAGVQAGLTNAPVQLAVSGLTPGVRYFARIRTRAPSTPTARATAVGSSQPVAFTFTAPGRIGTK